MFMLTRLFTEDYAGYNKNSLISTTQNTVSYKNKEIGDENINISTLPSLSEIGFCYDSVIEFREGLWYGAFLVYNKG